jgi:four helix bundle protein
MPKQGDQGDLERHADEFAVVAGIQVPGSRSQGIPDGRKLKDLEQRTGEFAAAVRDFVRALPRTICNCEDVKQVVRSSGSVAANYIEADEALSDKDFLVRIKICRKEAKESGLWLRLLDTGAEQRVALERDALVQESHELMLIFNAIVRKKGG